jgi:hypothetical protein
MQELLTLGAIVAIWYLLNRIILPKMGIQT